MLREIYLHGPLGEMYGFEPIKLYAWGWHDLYNGLKSRFPTFERQLRQFPNLGLMKRDPALNKNIYIEPDELALGFGKYEELHLAAGEAGAFIAAPAAAAAGGGYVVAGIAIASQAAAYAAWVVINIAIGVAMNAIMTSLQETPKAEEDKKPDNTSTLFSAPSNRTNQGARVQLVFGTFLADSVTLSQQVNARRQAVSIKDTLTVTEGESARINIFANNAGLVNAELLDFQVNGGAWIPDNVWFDGPIATTKVGVTYVEDGYESSRAVPVYAELPAYRILMGSEGTLVFETRITLPTNARTIQLIARYETGPEGFRTTEQEEVTLGITTYIPYQDTSYGDSP